MPSSVTVSLRAVAEYDAAPGRGECLMENILAAVVGLALGLGIASVLYLRVFTKYLHQLHLDNVEAQNNLKWSDQHVTRKVEEQNMTALSARLDQMEKDMLEMDGQ